MADGFESVLREAVEAWGIAPTDRALGTMRAHFRRVIEANTRFNLTRITRPGEAAIKLYADSLSVTAWANRSGVRVKTVLDAGTGAGFPGLPVAAMQPRWKVAAVDGTAKKARFVADCAREFGLDNLLVLHGRVEHLHPPPTYDLVLFKAVSRMDACLKWVRHLVRRGGHVVLYKTPKLPTEEEELGLRVAARLGYSEVDRFDYSLRYDDETLGRTLRLFRR